MIISSLRVRGAAVLTAGLSALLLTAVGAGPASAQTSTGCDDACKIAAARSYIDALLTHNADNVPFTVDAYRIENGINTGSSGAELRNDLNTSWKYHLILGERDIKLSVAGNTVSSTYTLDVGLANTKLASSHVVESFVICNGKIAVIKATFDIALGA
jgi:hypothetical protein